MKKRKKNLTISLMIIVTLIVFIISFIVFDNKFNNKDITAFYDIKYELGSGNDE